MRLENPSPGVIDWSQVPTSVSRGKSGEATARTRQCGEIQLRMVDYSSDYVADHWCSKGHVVFVISGELVIEHQDGCRYNLKRGMSYQVADDGPPHRVLSDAGATIFIVD
jgi:hypothetical protein